MPTINLTIQGKLAVAPCSYIVANNGDYVANVSFDPTWPSDAVKTLRINYNGAIYDSVFSGNEVKLPPLEYSHPLAEIGVFSDGMQTTRPASVPVFPSILTAGGTPAAPEDDVYQQLISLVNASKISEAEINAEGHLIITTADGNAFDAGYAVGPEGPMAGGTVTSVNGVLPDETGNVEIETVSQEEIGEAVDNYLTENPVEVTETDPTVPAWAKAAEKPSYTAAEVNALGGASVYNWLNSSNTGTNDLFEIILNHPCGIIQNGHGNAPSGMMFPAFVVVGSFSYGYANFTVYDFYGQTWKGTASLSSMTVTSINRVYPSAEDIGAVPSPATAEPGQMLVVSEVNDTGAPTAWETADVPEGGGGIEVTGATVGQTVKIAAVDDNGKPTAWEAVDLAGGGDVEEWELVSDITTEEDVSSVQLASGLALYKKLYVLASWNMNATYSLGLCANDILSSAYWLLKIAYGNYLGRAFNLWIESAIDGNTWVHGECLNQSTAFDTPSFYPKEPSEGDKVIDYVSKAAPKFPIDTLTLTTLSSTVVILTGAKFQVWGCK